MTPGPTPLRRCLLLLLLLTPLQAADERAVPASLSPEQRASLLRFLEDHSTPDRYVPRGAKLYAPPPAAADVTASKDKPIRQYTAQIKPHRPVPGQEQITRADVYFYRPNPEKGKQGITVKYTVDLTTGKAIGEPEVLTRAHTPISRQELTEAVAAVKERSEAVKKLYQGRQPRDVRYEYLQMKINRKNSQFEPGDRVLRFVFTANPGAEGKTPEPVRVLVNLTRDLVLPDDR